MSEIRIASRYAKSLIELSEEKGILEDVFKDMQLFSQVVQENKQFHLLLKNPIVHADKKQAIIKALFGKRFNKVTMTFFDLIIRKSREAYLLQVAEQFISQYNEKKGNISATVITSIPLSDDLRKQFRQIIKQATGKEVDLKEMVKEDIIGGFILKMGDKQVDESLKTKLEALKHQLTDKSYIKTY